MSDPVKLLSVEGLSVRAGELELVREVSFSIAPGERVGLIGESGSGKSLTALSLMGLLPEGVSASGTAVLGGHRLLGVPEKRLKGLRGRTVSMVFQEPMTALNPLMR
ncbi:ATP-binding cassette domain-containing protein, partial [Nonomuraea sp. NPDC059022]